MTNAEYCKLWRQKKKQDKGFENYKKKEVERIRAWRLANPEKAKAIRHRWDKKNRKESTF